MKKIHFATFIYCLFTPTVIFAGLTDNFQLGRENPNIFINNRVLARVNGKPITVLDVMKKMDILFLRQFPEYTSIPQARHQFYEINWKHVFEDLVDKELILADAEENKIEVTAGDVRQEMETLFGPNIIENLDKIGLSFEEAYKIVQGDLVIRRVMFMRVQSKALRAVTPQLICQAYEDFAKKNVRKETWHYRVISIRNKDKMVGQETAKLACHYLNEDKIPIDQLLPRLKETDHVSSLSLSDDFFHAEESLSELLKPTLLAMEPNTVSQPLEQKSRADNSTVFRVVFLKEKIAGGAIPFSEIEMQLKEDLITDAIEVETDAYLSRLRQHFDLKESYIRELTPEDFEPFALR